MTIEEFISKMKISKESQIAYFILGTLLITIAQFDNLLKIFNLEEVVASLLPYISILTLLSFSLLISKPIKDFFTVMYNKYYHYTTMTYFLKQLTNDEKVLLKSYLTDNVRAKYFDLSDGVASGLASKKLIYRSSNVGTGISTEFSYNIQDIAFNILKKNPKYLENS